ncbi:MULTISPECIES: sporulation membrane protein YtaF [Clostridium]|uniref:sporulation membrane protein YtaF n=1 Tax=Clostridium TaxID=1485 RepID=UPI0002CCAB91|nr:MULTISPECIES: sporulation membrane protein YtaF [Clostridium]AXB84510.1 sporulation membrane protein YtaF [Clostridium butyricum]EMU54283.1 putative sporulation protein YtaF [Clostridium butyricum DKU-01]KQB76831.1 sporulation protein [Clostridium butyricum]MBA8967268.1 putative sporulation protein YtaF [Clostridium butyricum]MBA8971666.1 putative sporulation protein YtaF [Clostridium butyricum]
MAVFLSALLYSLSSNLDNLVIGIAYGVKKIKIGITPNLIIATVTSIGTLISMSVGKFISGFLPTSLTNMLGAVIIMLLGLYFLIQSILKLIPKSYSNSLALKNVDEIMDYAEKSDSDNSGTLNIKEAFVVSLGLMLNNLGTGLAASITGVNVSITVICTFILSIALLMLGKSIGHNVLGSICGKYAPLISGVLLIILGIFELIN